MTTFENIAAAPRKRGRRRAEHAANPAAIPPPHPPTIKTLHRKLATIRDAVAKEGAETLGLWRAALAGSAFEPAAENLAHYLALRRRDLSTLQPALAAYGLSSLGRSEARGADRAQRAAGNARASLPASDRALSRALPKFNAGATVLRREQERFFGRRSRIASHPHHGDAADGGGRGPALVRRLVAAGMNCARINCAHDDPAVWAAMIANVRAAARQLGRDCAS